MPSFALIVPRMLIRLQELWSILRRPAWYGYRLPLIYLELLISHFIRPVESAELPNVARVSKSLDTPDLD
jgi:hypothetical protein